MATGFIVCGPHIRKQMLEKVRLVDVAPTVARILRLEMGEVEGRALDILD